MAEALTRGDGGEATVVGLFAEFRGFSVWKYS
jgi:hypothetical protein